MSGVKMIVSAMTDVGRARETNEDAFSIMDLASGKRIDAAHDDHTLDVQDRGVLLALSDGMGGAEAGEVASALVLESLQKALERDAKGAIHEQLEAAVQRANRNVFFEAKLENRQGMGATLVALFIRGDEAYIAEVGDSRGYLLRKGRLRQITRDQSLVQLLVDQGVMTPDEARASPSKNVILQAMGLAKDVRVAIARLRLRAGDRFVLCSDGITNPVSDPELQKILTASEPRVACATMIALANDRGGDDNQTAIVADLTGDGLPAPDEFETVTETYEVLKRYDATYRGKAVTQNVAQAAADKIRAKTASKSPTSVVVEDQAPSVAVPSGHSVPEAVPETVSSEMKAVVDEGTNGTESANASAPAATSSASASASAATTRNAASARDAATARGAATARDADAMEPEPSEHARSIHSTEPRVPMPLIIAAAITVVVVLLLILR
ncbi:MAG: PP2C family protein-serine/threonine phosphatase [Kofleriaceae bacterium]